jgi:predicted  nucleic acid-binding Zn-ribbon protein
MAWLEILLCPIAAVVTWTIAKSKASASLAREYAAMQKEIRYSQDEAAEARMRVAQIEQEMAAWSKGCRQGKEDLIAIMPLLLAAQERVAQSEPSPRQTPVAS